jgi:hypothetical protein
MNGGRSEEEARQEKVLSRVQQQTLLDLHRKVKGTYLQLTALLDALDLLIRPMLPPTK